MAWTPKQQQVIDDRNRSVLVSAAAGSGKTAVLIERIFSRIMDEDNPLDVDKFLVVTFTKAAAAQMREKLAAKIENELEANPGNSHLMRQMTLINHADITTIDSFCLRIVKEYAGFLDIDSDFNIGDNGMMELMKNDVLEEMFDEKYKEESNEWFIRLIDIYGNDKQDKDLKEEILKIYRTASSFTNTIKWLENAKAALDIEDEAALNQSVWMKKYIEIVHCYMADVIENIQYAKNLCEQSGGPDKNYQVVCDDEEHIRSILDASEYSALKNCFDFTWTRMKTCKGDCYDEDLIEEFKRIRNEYKEVVKSVNIFKETACDVLANLHEMQKDVSPLIDLTIDFAKHFMNMKKNRKLMEFSDISHMAYDLVCGGYKETEDGVLRPFPTEIGKEISKRYEEIFIDEYQDSNFLQEDILSSVSGMFEGRYNIFMVGDVKQSIYKFRMARPDLFIEKYDRFKSIDASNKEDKEIKIELQNNFRSREIVLESTNYFFYQLMAGDLGGIKYDKNAALIPTREFPYCEEENEKGISKTTEILIADAKTESNDENVSKLELEACMIAKRILELTEGENPAIVYDDNQNKYRKAQYKDIVILARSIKGFGETLYNILSEYKIPVYLEDPQGYFDAVEIKVLLSLLKIVDNIKQDVPYLAVLLSPIGGLNENDVAIICDYSAKHLPNVKYLHEKCECYVEDFDNELSVKLHKMIDLVGVLRNEKHRLTVSELIYKALELTDYMTYALAMPMGNRRKENINMLLEKADMFEDGYYKGLFNFLRYVEKLRINEVDFGEASVVSDSENIVRIISMHKSKGLEYPIVFASGLGRQFNLSDSKENLIVHGDYYLASRVMNTKGRYKKNTLSRNVFKYLIKNESIAEEFRILYVAMTRAKEKLILTGCDIDAEKLYEKYAHIAEYDEVVLPYNIRLNSLSYLQWLMAAMIRYNSLKDKIAPTAYIEQRILSYDEILSSRLSVSVKRNVDIDSFIEDALGKEKTEEYGKIKEAFEYKYPYESCTRIKSKMSISEIKKMKAYDGTGYDNDDTLLDKLNESWSNDEKRQKGESVSGLSGAARGTIVHKFMELIDFSLVPDSMTDCENYVKEFLDILLHKGVFTEEECGAINVKKICTMLQSELGKRMSHASRKKYLFKEQQFSIGIPVDKIFTDEEIKDADDVVIVQGIIDAFFIENDYIVLLDYKTDRATETELVNMYRAQLYYYGETIERLLGKKVKEKIIYSFYNNKTIVL